jgi:hypothetical protein
MNGNCGGGARRQPMWPSRCPEETKKTTETYDTNCCYSYQLPVFLLSVFCFLFLIYHRHDKILGRIITVNLPIAGSTVCGARISLSVHCNHKVV